MHAVALWCRRLGSQCTLWWLPSCMGQGKVLRQVVAVEWLSVCWLTPFVEQLYTQHLPPLRCILGSHTICVYILLCVFHCLPPAQVHWFCRHRACDC